MKPTNPIAKRASQAQVVQAYSVISKHIMLRSNLGAEQLAAAIGLDRADSLPDLLTAKDAAAFLGRSVKTLANWRVSGTPKLPFVKQGSRIAYRRDDLMIFVEKMTRNSTS